MSTTITQQIEELLQENERLKAIDSIVAKLIKLELGMDVKSIKKIIKNNAHLPSDFEKKICNYFHLKTATEMEQFLSIICTENTLNYYQKRCSSTKEKMGIDCNLFAE